MRGRTTFVIAHRLSTIRRADQILVIEAGRIIERGNHQTLYAQGGRYFDLYTKQHGLEANLFLAPGEGDAVPADATGVNGDGDGASNSAGSAGAASPSAESGIARAARILRGRES
jgi:ABC-type multidrug transport system ATPase subunit